MADNEKTIRIKIEAIINDSFKRLDELADKINKLPKTHTIDINTKEASKNISELSKQLDDLNKKIGEVGKKDTGIKDIAGGMKDVAMSSDVASIAIGTFTGKLAADVVEAFGRAIAEAARQMIDLGAKTEKAISQLSAMKNVTGNAIDTYRAFNDVGRNTNFDLDAVQQMGMKLLNMGYSAQEAADLIQLCADTSAGLGKGQAGAQQLIDAFARIQSTADITSGQLRMLRTMGLDLDKAFSSIGMTAEEAMKALDEGTINAQTAIQALTGYMHEFDGSMKQSQNNIIDMWGSVKDNGNTALGEIGNAIFEAFNQSEIVQTLLDFTEDLIVMVRGEGCGAFSDLAEVAKSALDSISTALKIIVKAIKFIILVLDEAYSAFRSFGEQVYEALQPAIDALLYVYNLVRDILASVGKGISGEIDKSWTKTYGYDPDDAGNQRVIDTDKANRLKTAIRSTKAPRGGSGGRGGGARAMSEEEKAIEALIKKYSDADKWARNVAKTQLEISKINLSMMSEEQKGMENKNVQLKALELAHTEVMKGYEKELKIAEKIASEEKRKEVTESIKSQIAVEEQLNATKKKQVEYEDAILQRRLQASAFGRGLQHIQNLFGMGEITSTESLEMQNQLLEERKEQLQRALDEDLEMHTLHDEQRVQMETQLMQTIKMLNANAAYDVKGGWLQALQEIANQQLNFKDAFTSIFSTIESGLVNLITATGSAKDKFKNFLNEVTNSILKAMTQIIIKGLITNAILSVLGLGGNRSVSAGNLSGSTDWVRNFTGGSLAGSGGITVGAIGIASGGYVMGAGTSTSDSIPAMLSNGEYVLNAEAVKRIGVPKLDSINNGGVPTFAQGGFVGGYTSSGNNAPNVVINVDNQTGAAVEMEQNGSKFDGEKWVLSVVMKGMQNNTMGMRSAFKGVTS